MKASEIRLGNYFNVPIKEQSPFRIDAFEYASDSFVKVSQKQTIDGTEVHPLTWYGGDLKPIPITEDWLLKFGYIKFDSEKIYTEWFLNFDSILKYKIMQDKRYDNTFIMPNENKPIKLQYVHQLQNLYFALTGEELTLNK